MDSISQVSEEISTEIIFEQEIESTEDPPMDEWSSIDLDPFSINSKLALYEKGLYDPGSDEICGKYLEISDSNLTKHLFYDYPIITDPGVVGALLEPDAPVVYPADGQNLYLAICEKMNQCPVRLFYKGLLESEVDLKYYGVNPHGIRAMSMALTYNNFVTSFNLSDNFLNDDACYHLGDMLVINSTIDEINLSGCRIGPHGLQIFLERIFTNRSLKKLDLSRNNLSDEGMIYLANAVFRGLNVTDINLSSNDITGKGVESLTEAFETHNKITAWNLSWNKLFLPGTYSFLVSLTESTKMLMEIDLSWNNMFGTRVATGIKSLFKIPCLRYLNVSNNKFAGEAIAIIVSNLKIAKYLVTLNLSFNPLTTQDALLVLRTLKFQTVKMAHVYMDNISVTPTFVQLLQKIRVLKPELVVTYGDVVGNFKIVGPTMQDLVLNRVEYLCKRAKKVKVDFALVVLQLQKENVKRVHIKEFTEIMKTRFRAPLDVNIVAEIVKAFSSDPSRKYVDINMLVDYIKRKWPDRHLPATPTTPH